MMKKKSVEDAHFDRELELFVELGYEHVVTERLPHLHDPHDGGVDLVLPVLEHLLCRTRVLLGLQAHASPRLQGVAMVTICHHVYNMSPWLQNISTFLIAQMWQHLV